MDYSTVAIAVSFSQWDEDRSNPQLVLKFSNPSSQTRTLVLPCPLNENATTFGSPERPILVLIARELVTSGEDGFVLTDLSNRTRDAGKSLVLKPGESAGSAFSACFVLLLGTRWSHRKHGFFGLLTTGRAWSRDSGDNSLLGC